MPRTYTSKNRVKKWLKKHFEVSHRGFSIMWKKKQSVHQKTKYKIKCNDRQDTHVYVCIYYLPYVNWSYAWGNCTSYVIKPLFNNVCKPWFIAILKEAEGQLD